MINTLNLNGLIALLATIAIFLSCNNEPLEVENNPPDPDPIENPFAGEIRDLSSKALVEEMGVGWNLGNSLDVRSKDKTEWGNPLPTGAMIHAVKEMGFTTLRIPTTWDYNQSNVAPYTVESTYLATLKQVVNNAIKNDMHVIINVHHDDWIKPTTTDANVVNARLKSLWTQVAEYFIEYGDVLIFETMNEPRLHGSPEEWSGGTQEGRDILNQYNKTALDAIRATGGNNTKRHIMIPTYAASSNVAAMNDLEIPNDDLNVIISIHTYFPWSFAGEENGQSVWGTDQEKMDLSAELERIREKWIVQEGRPVILGEWGAIDRNNLAERLKYTEYYAAEALKRGFLPIVWDDGGNFGLFDRSALEWRYPEIAAAIVKADM